MCLLQKHAFGFFDGFTDDDRYAELDDTGFFSGNLSECVAEEHGVVERDIGDDREARRNDVGAVEPSSQTHFDDGNVDFPIGKVLERHGCGQLEEGWRKGFEEDLFFFYEIHYIAFLNALAVDADALPEIDEMG